jgi:hypothetical protein
MAKYTVFDHGRTVQGDARTVLERIRGEASRNNAEIQKMDLDQYADALIEDAPYFLEDALLRALQTQPFDSKYDQALNYLAQMPTSGIRILTVKAA